jgi:hypothetical protein
MFAQKSEVREDDEHICPIVKLLFSPDADLTTEIPHLKYLETL